ncbi:hypothetical protein [Albidovulum aquaemixtae]|nr:hypothetical protein [Defluviimonas aquaemixtae]
MLVWPLFDPFDMAPFGYVVLWSAALIVLGPALVELFALVHRH